MEKGSINGLEFLRKDLTHPYSEYNGDLKKLFEVPHINLLQSYESNRDIRMHGHLGFQRVTMIQDQGGL